QVKNEFIATASHDLKNPLTSIGGFATLLGQAGPLNESQKEFVERIQHSVKNMTELVHNMMALVQTDLEATQKHEMVNLCEILTEMTDDFLPQAEEKLQAFKVTSPAEPVFVQGDPLQLRQVFRNLIGNAIKYTPQGGRIQVKAKVEAEQVLVHVEDNGYGIPAADLPFIFNRFYRVRSGKASEMEGNGLGLAIVKSVIEQHQGEITVESQYGEGTRFRFVLPLAD
ncbi:MAG TPA: HAMP domain-containing sensor histidine kinase, partial [Anaerolineales bacterium]|nr:HAMP domain-containing sensor histidine kinase [Anaerolineales bacterium]